MSIASDAHVKFLKDPLFKLTMKLPLCRRMVIILTAIAISPCQRFKVTIEQPKVTPLNYDFRWKHKIPRFKKGSNKLFHCGDTFQILMSTSPYYNKVSVNGQIKKTFTNRRYVQGGQLKILGNIEIMSLEIK
ncbi:uncharacterized protein LOC128249093 [Octopus bimaculoides]|uniref:uncharacterized protein LOC128249093 n=1 Tax=Octopus bimaculoides TaxID=37653 RepID=UPI0022E91AC7|nr:uncharacterized protein LOC128249093 [Octopus bimaculoides]